MRRVTRASSFWSSKSEEAAISALLDVLEGRALSKDSKERAAAEAVFSEGRAVWGEGRRWRRRRSGKRHLIVQGVGEWRRRRRMATTLLEDRLFFV